MVVVAPVEAGNAWDETAKGNDDEVVLPFSDIQGTPRPTGLKKFLNKGDLSNLATFIIMLLGVLVEVVFVNSGDLQQKYNFVLAFGLFGFAGGITNWLAVKMLFDRIPGLIGSGVIPNRFREIRGALKDTIMRSFFDEQHLQQYIETKGPEMMAKCNLAGRVETFIASPEFDGILIAQLEELSTTPEGAMLMMLKQMMPFPMLVTMVKPMLNNVAKDMVARALPTSNLGAVLDLKAVRAEIDGVMEEKLQLLTADIIKRLIEDVIREHLGWLVVWGNVFGGLIGVITLAVRGTIV
jgi:uncharacterized membrane-anchored protein YjiN (DUF445 family)